MFSQYINFLINGCFLGVVALGLQNLLFHLLGGNAGASYALATAATYIPLILLNFYVQRSVIFVSSGRLTRFFFASFLIMALVSALAPICRSILSAIFGLHAGNWLGFVFAALLGATPSFLISRYWVFSPSKDGVKP